MKFKGFAAKTLIKTIAAALILVLVVVFFNDILNVLLKVFSILAPFILAFILSLLLNPIAEILQKKLKLPRGVTTILVVILAIVLLGGVVGGIVWKVISELKNMYLQLPEITQGVLDWVDKIRNNLSHIYMSMPQDIQSIFDNMGDNIRESLTHIINDNYKPVVYGAGNIAKKLPSIFVAIIVFILSLFFMISGEESISDKIKNIIPKKVQDKTSKVMTEMKKSLGGYIKAQLIIMSIAFVIIFAGLSILKIEYALLIALGVALLDALPFFGSGAVLIPWSVISFINVEVRNGVGLLIIYLAVIFTRQMIEPKIVSSKIGINPLITLMSMYIGYRLLSFGGMILGPILLVLVISLNKAGAFEPIKNFLKTTINKIKEELK